jgi:uncharacterized protein
LLIRNAQRKTESWARDLQLTSRNTSSTEGIHEALSRGGSLLDLVGTRDLVVQSMDAMSKSIKPLLTNSLPPGDYREKLVNLFFEKFTTKTNVQHLLDMAVPIYDKNFSREEIHSLMAFYQTPLGKKTVSTLPRLSLELQEEGRKWGESLGRESMQEVLAEHPDLEQALIAAQKTPPPADK